MESWPTDNRETSTLSSQDDSQSKGKGKENAASCDYPSLNYGLMNATTLEEKNGQFEWTTVVNTDGTLFSRLSRCLLRGCSTGVRLKPLTRSTLVFPATRGPSLSVGQATLSQRAEHGVCRFYASVSFYVLTVSQG